MFISDLVLDVELRVHIVGEHEDFLAPSEQPAQGRREVEAV